MSRYIKTLVLLTAFICLGVSGGYAQTDAPTEERKVITEFFEAFNYHDIIRMMEYISEDFIMYSITSDTLKIDIRGREALNKIMIDYFNGDYYNAESSLDGIHQQGSLISFSETVRWGPEQRHSQTSLAVYEVMGDKITRVWYYYPSE